MADIVTHYYMKTVRAVALGTTIWKYGATRRKISAILDGSNRNPPK